MTRSYKGITGGNIGVTRGTKGYKGMTGGNNGLQGGTRGYRGLQRDTGIQNCDLATTN